MKKNTKILGDYEFWVPERDKGGKREIDRERTRRGERDEFM